MKSKMINYLAQSITFHWHNMEEEPKLGKLILVKTTDQVNEEFQVEKFKCKPLDLNSYSFSIGFLDKSNSSESKVFGDVMFVAKDYMFQPYEREEKRSPFLPMFFEKWIYISDILNLDVNQEED